MIDKSILDGVYRVLLIAGMAMLIVLLINNFVIYRRKFKDYISLMIIACIFTCTFELLWTIFEGDVELGALTYISSICYVTFFMIFASIFNRFFLNQFNCLPKRKWLIYLMYVVPNATFFIFSVTTPWTGLVFLINSQGVLKEGVLFYVLFPIIIFAYIGTALIVAIVDLVKNKGKNVLHKKITFLLIGCAIIAPLFWVVQILILGFESLYVDTSICLALALVFLISNLNSLLLVDSETKMKEVESELKIASSIQESALPPADPHFDEKFGVAIRASMNTAKEVGGDFYDYFPIDDKRICFLAADVSGKGAPAALFMMTAKTVIKDHALIYGDTSKIFQLSNNRLQEGNKAMMFATSWIAILNTETMTLQYTNAGHTYPIYYHHDKGADYIKKVDGLFLGAMRDIPYQSNTIKVEKGDRLFLYTDGVTESHNTKNELYGEDRLLEIFSQNVDKSEDEILDIISKDVGEFSNGAPQFDDITMMILTIK